MTDTTKIYEFLFNRGLEGMPPTVDSLFKLIDLRKATIADYQQEIDRLHQNGLEQYRSAYKEVIRQEIMRELRTMTIGELADAIAEDTE